MSVLTTGTFWSASLERAVKTFAQTLVATLTLAGITAAEVAAINWADALLLSGIATLLSVLSSIASVGVGHAGPSLASEELAVVPDAVVPDAAE